MELVIEDIECLLQFILFLWLNFYWVEIFEIFSIYQLTLVKEEVDWKKCPNFAIVSQLLTSLYDDSNYYFVARLSLYFCPGTQAPCKLIFTLNSTKVERPRNLQRTKNWKNWRLNCLRWKIWYLSWRRTLLWLRPVCRPQQTILTGRMFALLPQGRQRTGPIRTPRLTSSGLPACTRQQGRHAVHKSVLVLLLILYTYILIYLWD